MGPLIDRGCFLWVPGMRWGSEYCRSGQLERSKVESGNADYRMFLPSSGRVTLPLIMPHTPRFIGILAWGRVIQGEIVALVALERDFGAPDDLQSLLESYANPVKKPAVGLRHT